MCGVHECMHKFELVVFNFASVICTFDVFILVSLAANQVSHLG